MMDVTSNVEIGSNETVLTTSKQCQVSSDEDEPNCSSDESPSRSYLAADRVVDDDDEEEDEDEEMEDDYMMNGGSSLPRVRLNPRWNSFDEIVGEEMSVDDYQVDTTGYADGQDGYEDDNSYEDDFSSSRAASATPSKDSFSTEEDAFAKRKIRKSRVQARKEEETEAAGLDYELLMAYRIVKHLMSDSNKYVNMYFVDEDSTKDYKDYHKVIKNPMWLRKVLSQLLGGAYTEITEVIRDLRIILENCYRYHGRGHNITKKALKMEMMLEQRLNLLPRNLREKTALELTSPHLFDDNVNHKGTPRRFSSVSLGETSLISSVVWNESKARAREFRQRQTVERRAEKEAAYQGIVDWEKNLINEDMMKSMWELPQIGQFLYLSQVALNIPEVSQYELERIFAMPRESSLLATIMTSLLCKTKLRAKIDQLPSMPYKIWEKWLRRKVDTFFKVYNSKEKNVLKVFEMTGIEPEFFSVLGEKNPLEEKSFHELPFQQRVWLVKGLCDFCLHNQKTVQEAIAENPLEDQKDYILGTDRDGFTYLHFPQFCGPALRIYKRAKLGNPPMPSTKIHPTSAHHEKMTEKNEKSNDKEVAKESTLEASNDKDANKEGSKPSIETHSPIRSARLRQKKAEKESQAEKEAIAEKLEKENGEVDAETKPDAPASQAHKFIMVVDSIESLRALIESFPSEPRKRKNIKLAVQREEELVENLKNLLKELEPWESKLVQSTRRVRARLKKQFDDYWRKINRGIENNETTIWDSEPEEAGPEEAEDADSSDSSSSTSDSEESDSVQSASTHKGKKRKAEEVEEISEDVRQEMFEDSVCTRERLKNAKKFLRKLKTSHKEEPKAVQNQAADKTKDTESVRKANYINTTALMAQGQYEWETRRQTLLSSFKKEEAVTPNKDKTYVIPQINSVKKTPILNMPSTSEHLKPALQTTGLITQTPERPKNKLPCYASSQPSLKRFMTISESQVSHSFVNSNAKNGSLSVSNNCVDDESGSPPHLPPVSLLQVPLPPSLSQQNNHHNNRNVRKHVTQQKSKSVAPSSRSSNNSQAVQKLVQVASSTIKGQGIQMMHFQLQTPKSDQSSASMLSSSTSSQDKVSESLTTKLDGGKSTSVQSQSVLLIPIVDQQGNKVYLRVIQNGKGAANPKVVQQPGTMVKVINKSQSATSTSNASLLSNQQAGTMKSTNTTTTSLLLNKPQVHSVLNNQSQVQGLRLNQPDLAVSQSTSSSIAVRTSSENRPSVNVTTSISPAKMGSSEPPPLSPITTLPPRLSPITTSPPKLTRSISEGSAKQSSPPPLAPILPNPRDKILPITSNNNNAISSPLLLTSPVSKCLATTNVVNSLPLQTRMSVGGKLQLSTATTPQFPSGTTAPVKPPDMKAQNFVGQPRLPVTIAPSSPAVLGTGVVTVSSPLSTTSKVAAIITQSTPNSIQPSLLNQQQPQVKSVITSLPLQTNSVLIKGVQQSKPAVQQVVLASPNVRPQLIQPAVSKIVSHVATIPSASPVQQVTQNVIVRPSSAVTTAYMPVSVDGTTRTILQAPSSQSSATNKIVIASQENTNQNVSHFVCIPQVSKEAPLTQAVTQVIQSGQAATVVPVQGQRPVFFLSHNGQLVQLNLPPSQVSLILGKKREQ